MKSIIQNITGDKNIVTGIGDIKITYKLPLSNIKERQKELNLVNKVKNFWIKGVLENSLYQDILIEIKKEKREELTISDPWKSTIQINKNNEFEILGGVDKLIEQFRLSDNTLLITGEAGSGKTTSMLLIVKLLIKECINDPTKPIPVVFNLSSWKYGKKISIWILEELKNKYKVPTKIGRKWIQECRILPILDGLDEVESSKINTCILNINKYSKENGLSGIIVCSRYLDYIEQESRLELGSCVYLKPLDKKQISTYLKTFKDQNILNLEKFIVNNREMVAITSTPLMLNIITITFFDNINELKKILRSLRNQEEKLRDIIFKSYIRKMFVRKGMHTNKERKNTIYYLNWISTNMIKHNQSIFLIENIQPSWLNTTKHKYLYIFLTYGLLIQVFWIEGYYILFPISILGLLNLIKNELLIEGKNEFLFKRRYSLLFYLIIVLIIALFDTEGATIFASLFFYFSFFFIIKRKKNGWSNDITFVEDLGWSSKNWLNYRNKIVLVLIGLIPAILFFLGFKVNDVELKTKHNQGISSTFKNSILISCLISIILIPISLGINEINNIFITFLLAFWTIIFFAFPFGGLDVVKHYILRLFISLFNNIGFFRLYKVLRTATRLTFTKRVGGGYIFMHRYLMEYFSDKSKLLNSE